MVMRLFVSSVFLFFSFQAFATNPLTPSRYMQISGLNVAVYESAGTAGPGVLLLHGNTSSANAFARIMESPFAQTHRLVAVDMPGFGHSDDSSTYTVGLFKTVISQVAQATGVDSGIIVGWSLGGDLALQSVSVLPHIKGYFFIGTAPVGSLASLPPPFLTPLESYAGVAVLYPFVGILLPFQINNFVRGFFRPYYPVPQMFFDDGQRCDGDTRTAILLAASGLDPDFQNEVNVISGLSVPVALVIGEKDAYVRRAYLDSIAPQVQNLWQNQVIVVNGSGHAVLWEMANETVSMIEQFIDDLP